jgi:2'-5' RNA ligase
MSEINSTGYGAGETALIAKVPEAESLIGAWRSRFDSAAAAGVPAHITVLYPYLDRRLADAGVVQQLETLFAGHRAFEVRLTRCRRFPDVLYLAPEPDTEFRALTGAVAGRWPEAPPFRGQFNDVVPHLTVAHNQETRVFDMIESDISGGLPVIARISSVCLITFTGGCWRDVRSFALAAD